MGPVGDFLEYYKALISWGVRTSGRGVRWVSSSPKTDKGLSRAILENELAYLQSLHKLHFHDSWRKQFGTNKMICVALNFKHYFP